MIQRYAEKRLCKIVLASVTIFTAIYLALGIGFWSGDTNYGILPTFDLSVNSADNDHLYLSLIFFIIITLAEGLTCAYFLDQMREIKKEFSMLPELQKFTAVWLVTTDLTLIVVIQGVASGWFVEITYYRFMFWLYLIRQLGVAAIATAQPLIYSFDEDAVFFPIPPNRECIEQVDMLLHIPVALDFFCEFLERRK